MRRPSAMSATSTDVVWLTNHSGAAMATGSSAKGSVATGVVSGYRKPKPIAISPPALPIASCIARQVVAS